MAVGLLFDNALVISILDAASVQNFVKIGAHFNFGTKFA